MMVNAYPQQYGADFDPSRLDRQGMLAAFRDHQDFGARYGWLQDLRRSEPGSFRDDAQYLSPLKMQDAHAVYQRNSGLLAPFMERRGPDGEYLHEELAPEALLRVESEPDAGMNVFSDDPGERRVVPF